MAIRNLLIGGTNVVYGEGGLSSADWNDTFDEIVRLVDNGN